MTIIRQDLIQLALSGAISPEEFERELWVRSKGHIRRAGIFKNGQVRIYRTRSFLELEHPKSVAEISYPPKRAARVNRANLEGEPVFFMPPLGSPRP